jgi:endonuclease G
MIIRKILFITSIFLFPLLAYAQNVNERIVQIKDSLEWIETLKTQLWDNYNDLSCELIIDDLETYGLPSQNYKKHKAYAFEYSEEHEQAKWVAHVILPDVKKLGSKRTNDFRMDPLVETGTTDSIDYYAYDASKEGDKRYFSYGYDRGHLAPSADFRWSREAMSESYYYSNISPQAPQFNRGKWADLEAMLRKYVISNNVKLVVITAPILKDDLPKIKQSPNGVSIPEQFIKIAFDPTNGRTIGFLMNNNKLSESLESYVKSVDEIEALTGYNFFPNIDEAMEESYELDAWFEIKDSGDIEPILQSILPNKYFNSTAGIKQAGSNKKIHVCGTVVDSRYSRKGHAWLNIDKKYPNQVFSIMVRKEELEQFPFDPIVYYVNKELCFEGKVEQWGKIIVMTIDKPERVSPLVQGN